MRLLPLISTIALLSMGSTLSLVTSASADETKYKSRQKPPPPNEPNQPAYKRPPNQPQRPPDPPRPPAERPPSKEHPIKPPPPPRRPDVPQPPPPPPPHGRPHDPWCPPPPPCDRGWNDGIVIDPIERNPIEEPIVVPIQLDFKTLLLQRVRMMEIDGFEGEVVVGYNGQVEFDRRGGFETQHEIGVVSQAFTGWAIYRLIESDRLSLTTRIGQLFADVPEDKRFITIEQLLRHTSGLGNTYAGEGETERNVAVRKLLAQPLATGDAFNYSDDGYVVLAAVVESVTSLDYAQFLRESGVVSPDMRNTGELDNLDWGVRGTGGMLSTARDLFVWTSHFLVSDERPEITQPRAWTEDGVGLAYGWIRTGDAPQLLQTSAAMENGQNVAIVVYPHSTILVVTSDRFNGDVPWSERAANELEPVMRTWNPYDPPRWKLVDGEVVGQVYFPSN